MNDVFISGKVLSNDKEDTIKLNYAEFQLFKINSSPLGREISHNHYLCMVDKRLYRIYYSQMNEGDYVTVKGYLKKIFISNRYERETLRTVIVAREIFKLNHYKKIREPIQRTNNSIESFTEEEQAFIYDDNEVINELEFLQEESEVMEVKQEPLEKPSEKEEEV